VDEIQLLDGHDGIVELIAGLLNGIIPQLSLVIEFCEVQHTLWGQTGRERV
jgi:hypothetical protein